MVRRSFAGSMGDPWGWERNGCVDRRSAPPEQPLDIGKLELDVSRPAVIALPGMGGRLHLAQKRVHLGEGEAPPGAHAAVAGERAADRLEPLLERERLAQLGELVGE